MTEAAFGVQHHDRALALRARSHVRAGPFVCRFSPHLPDAFANFAIPDDDAEPTAADVQALVQVFKERGRTPRLEFLAGCAPCAEQILTGAGFTVDHRGIVMACAPRWLTAPGPVPGLELAEPSGDADLESFALVQHHAFAEPGEPGPGAVARLARMREEGGLVVLARYRGRIVGGGAATASVNGVGELDGVAVTESARHRGIGSAVSARLTALAHRRGYRLVWLEPAGPAARRVYTGVGYRPIAEKLYITLGPEPGVPG
jgi:GNAT superfamily N-acetyltransferase